MLREQEESTAKAQIELNAHAAELSPEEFAQKQADLAKLKAKARAGLLEAQRNGQLEKLSIEFDKAQADLEERQKNLHAIKKKAKKNLKQGLKNGELASLQKAFEDMESVQVEEFFLRIN